MRKLVAIAGVVAVGLGTQTTALGYGVTAAVNFSWGGSNDLSWQNNSQSAGGTITAFNNATYLTSLGGNDGTGYYNSDFASVGQCASLVGSIAGASGPITRKYGCRYASTTVNGDPGVGFVATPITGVGPGAQASGVLTVTDTTLTGVLTILSTTDVPTGGNSTSIGTGTNGYNLRQADGSPFGNSWFGVTTLGTYTVNLTGTFTATSWQINGGAAKFSDAGFGCQQGANGTTLCNPGPSLSTNLFAPGGFTTTGGSLSWGWELDGAGSANGNAVTGIDVRSSTDNSLITTLSGVLANLSVDGLGNITTNQGEVRRGLGTSGLNGCNINAATKSVSYNASINKLTCGSLIASALNITGTVVPVPAAVWLFGSALGLLGVARRRMVV